MRKITAIVMSLILLVSLSVSASAAATLAFLLQEYDVVSDEVFCYGKQLPARGKLEVSVGSRIVKDAALSTLEKEKIPVTVYCLVDSATSQAKETVRQREEMLLTLSRLMSSEDSMVLATIDSVLTESKPMNDRDVRDKAINTITGQTWYTNLYDGISHALKVLHTSTSYNTNRCLVILSDGHDDGKSIATSENIRKQIQEAGIPVYSVILGSTITEKELTLQKQFTNDSLGGFLSFLDQDKTSTSDAAQQIWRSIKGASVIRIGTEELQAAGTDQQLLIRYDSADTRYEDTILIRAVDLPVPSPEPSTETTQMTEDPAGTEELGIVDPEPDDGLPLGLLLACGIGVVLLGAGIAAFFLLRKKPEQEKNASVTPWPDDFPDNSGSADDSESLDITNPPPFDPLFSGVTMPVAGRCHVCAVAIMHPEVTADFYLTPNMQIAFGRNSKADIILNQNDESLSSLHGYFFWDGKKLLVQDNHSTNGTAVNGELCPENVWLRLDEGAVLTAGKYEYRINFKVED